MRARSSAFISAHVADWNDVELHDHFEAASSISSITIVVVSYSRSLSSDEENPLMIMLMKLQSADMWAKPPPHNVGSSRSPAATDEAWQVLYIRAFIYNVFSSIFVTWRVI
jgi:hypothetical protein